MSAQHFSTALQLTDLNDFISPSQTCIKPIPVPKPTMTKVNQEEEEEIHVSKDDAIQPAASINLNDCLACSGCVTSAESVLISAQSHTLVLTHLQSPQKTDRPLVISLSRQSVASLAAKYDCSLTEMAQKILWFCESVLGAVLVLDIAMARDLVLRRTVSEMMCRLEQHMSVCPDLYARPADPTPSTTNPSPQAQPRVRGRRPRDSTIPAQTRIHGHTVPMITSACPGWICYAEKKQAWVLPLISTTKSPQQVSGSLVRTISQYPTAFHVAIMPCYDKKLEASRPAESATKGRNVEVVLTTTEFDTLMHSAPHVLGKPCPESVNEFPHALLNGWFKHAFGSLLGTPGSSSGGYLEYAMVQVSRQILNVDLTDPQVRRRQLHMITTRSGDLVEYTVKSHDALQELRFAAVYGFTNIQNALRKIRGGGGRPVYHFIEIMACPSGCVNGGGQIPPPSYAVQPKEWVQLVNNKYNVAEDGVEWPHENQCMAQLVGDHGCSDDLLMHDPMFQTEYHAVDASIVAGISTGW